MHLAGLVLLNTKVPAAAAGCMENGSDLMDIRFNLKAQLTPADSGWQLTGWVRGLGVAGPVSAGRHAGPLLEKPGEVERVVEPGFVGNFTDG